MIQIDIARLLLNRAGFSLAEAQTAHVANNEQICIAGQFLSMFAMNLLRFALNLYIKFF